MDQAFLLMMILTTVIECCVVLESSHILNYSICCVASNIKWSNSIGLQNLAFLFIIFLCPSFFCHILACIVQSKMHVNRFSMSLMWAEFLNGKIFLLLTWVSLTVYVASKSFFSALVSTWCSGTSTCSVTFTRSSSSYTTSSYIKPLTTTYQHTRWNIFYIFVYLSSIYSNKTFAPMSNEMWQKFRSPFPVVFSYTMQSRTGSLVIHPFIVYPFKKSLSLVTTQFYTSVSCHFLYIHITLQGIFMINIK